jgi:hypothetical protein
MAARAGVVLVVLTLLLAGCGGGGSARTVPVSGRITLKGKPLAKALVTFVPVVPKGTKDPPPGSLGTTDDDGRYTLVLNNNPKITGAVVGKHQVIITTGAGGGGSAGGTKPTYQKQLPEKYNRKTELTCDVPEGGRQDANFDLQPQ